MPRTKGSKNKKTLLKEQKTEHTDPTVIANIVPVKESNPLYAATRLFTLEKKVHDDFIQTIFQLGDVKLYESYIVNELMVKYINNKIKLPEIDIVKMQDYMLAYGHVGLEDKKMSELDEFKAANRLIQKKQNSFIQYQYPIIVDPDVKMSVGKKYSTSYIMNELLKLFIADTIKVDLRDHRIKNWEMQYKYALKKQLKQDGL